MITYLLIVLPAGTGLTLMVALPTGELAELDGKGPQGGGNRARRL